MIREIKESIKKPNDYNKENIKNIIKENPVKKKPDNQKAPNIIMIMNETFYDVRLLEDVKISEDPYRCFQK
jgi:hypothetical protein